MKRLFSGCLIIIAVSFLLGCGLNTVVFFVIPTLNQNKWNELKPERYSLNINYGTAWGTYSVFQESVDNGIARRSSSSLGYRGASIREPIIDELFNQIKAELLNPFALLWYSIEYEPVYGYPMRIEEFDFDLGDVTEIKDFTPEN